MTVGHFSFQCSIILEESLVSNTRDEIIEYLVYKGVQDLLPKESILRKSSDSMLHMKLIELLPMLQSYCQERLSGNPLVVESKVPCKIVVPEDNHLQEPQDKEEEHQKGEVDKERYITNTLFDNDASLFSDDSCNAKTDHNLYAEALRLETHKESITDDELEIEPCYESFNANMQEPIPDAKEGYYEVFPYNGNQGKNLKIMFQPITLPLQLHKKACSPHLVHPHSLESENLFIYKMPMHRKRVRL